MTYIILILGFVFVLIAVKAKKEDTEDKRNTDFSNVLNKRMNVNSDEGLENEISYLSIRIDDLEKSLILLNDKMDKINAKIMNMNNFENKASENIELTIQELSISESSRANAESADKAILNDEKEIKTDTSGKSDDINLKIFEMCESGKSIDDIASILKIGKGEVLLRIGLKKPKK